MKTIFRHIKYRIINPIKSHFRIANPKEPTVRNCDKSLSGFAIPNILLLAFTMRKLNLMTNKI